MIYDALTIAKWIINRIHPEPLKLQKLLYFAQGYSYAFYDRPLFNDEMEGWVHGPVIPSVYRMFSNYKYNSIDDTYEDAVLDDDAKDVLNYVIKNYATLDAKSLEKLTHNQEPWIYSRDGIKPNVGSNNIINKQDIANYFISEVFQPDAEEWD